MSVSIARMRELNEFAKHDARVKLTGKGEYRVQDVRKLPFNEGQSYVKFFTKHVTDLILGAINVQQVSSQKEA